MPDLTNIDDAQLRLERFTDPGIAQFKKAVGSYATELLKRSVLIADAEKLEGEDREGTGTHVRQAARDIAARPSRRPPSSLSIFGQVAEYVLYAGAGAGAGHLDKKPGIIAFGICLTLATILVVTRLVRGRS